MYWYIEGVIMKFLPPRSKRGGFLDILSGLKEFMKE
jgi:hypothetical protein